MAKANRKKRRYEGCNSSSWLIIFSPLLDNKMAKIVERELEANGVKIILAKELKYKILLSLCLRINKDYVFL